MDEFNPYATPESAVAPRMATIQDEAGCWRQGDMLVMTKDADLPDRCIKCNSPSSNYRLRRKLSWHHPLWFVLAISPLIYLIVAMIVRQTATLHVGLCPDHRSSRTRALILTWILCLTGVALMVLCGAFVRDELIGYVFLGGLLLFFGGIIFGVMSTQVTQVKKIDRRFVWLKKVDPAYLSQFDAWPG